MSLCCAGSAHGRHDAVEEGRRAAGRPVQAAWTRWMQRLASKAAMAVATGSAPGERCPARRRADASSARLKGLLTASCYCLLLLQEAFEQGIKQAIMATPAVATEAPAAAPAAPAGELSLKIVRYILSCRLALWCTLLLATGHL